MYKRRYFHKEKVLSQTGGIMYIPKKYGESRIDKCPFCNQQATMKNTQQIPVCSRHRETLMDDLICACGSTLEMKDGKWGAYFSCYRCGNMNLRKALEINHGRQLQKGAVQQKEEKSADAQKTKRDAYEAHKDNSSEQDEQMQEQSQKEEMVVRSDDPRYFD